nr:MAG TPA: hypothetical protein [Caudoviricetes sp.]
MATKTFEELKQLAIQIRDEKTNKQNTATRVGTAMLEHINKLEQDYYDKEGTNTELQKRDNKLTELSAEKLRKIPILDKNTCSKGNRYIDIENLILDLEIITDSDKLFAPVAFNFESGTYFYIDFYEVDEHGNYLKTFNKFRINFNTAERNLLYILDKQVQSDNLDYTAKVSIAIDSSVLNSKFDAYSPSLLSEDCKKEHYGIINIIRKLSSINVNISDIYSILSEYGNEKQSRISLFDMEKCFSNPYIRKINNFLLDLEIIWDKEPTESYALVSIDGSEGKRVLNFYDVDKSGNYTNNFYKFQCSFDPTKPGVQYVLDAPISVNGNTGKLSIVVDWDKWTTKVDAMKPSYHANSIYSEHVGPIMYLRKLNELGIKIDDNLNTEGISNGKKKTYLTFTNVSGVIDKTDNSFVIQTSSSGDSWCFTRPPFTPTGNNYVHIKFKLDCLTPELFEEGAPNTANLWLSAGNTTVEDDKYTKLKVCQDGEEVHYSFDPAYYTVYKEWTEFGVWIGVSAGTSGGTVKWKVTDFEVYELEGAVNGLEGETLKDVLDNAAYEINALQETVSNLSSSNTELISASGNKYELSVQDDGILVALPIIPSKGAMIGNSLIGGSEGFGMAASDDKHDYFHLITEAIKTLNSKYTSTRHTASITSSFEGLTSEGGIDAAVKKITDSLTGDEDLVSIQLGDNVNTPEKVKVFPKSSLALCKALRAKCTKARIVWMGMWYGLTEKYNAIQNACGQTGCKFISFQDLLGYDSNSRIGNVQKLNSSTQRTVTDVTDVTENSNSDGIKNITVSFTVSGTHYKSTLDVTDYSLQEGTLSYTSEYSIITSGGVAGHPGNEGFRRISNKFLKEMKLTEEDEYYSEEKGNWVNTQYFK